MAQKELLSAFQSGLSQSFSLVEQMSPEQRQAAALALQGLLQKTPIADVVNSKSKTKSKEAEVACKSSNKPSRQHKDAVPVSGKKYKMPRRGRPRNRELNAISELKKRSNTSHVDDSDSAESENYTEAGSSEAKGAACDLCGRYFSQRGNMQRHRMRHTGERPWQCDQCGAGFIEKKSLLMHCQRKHSDKSTENPMYCEVCGVRFRSKLHAAKHSCLKKETVGGDHKTSKVKTSFTVHIKKKLCHMYKNDQKQAESASTKSRGSNGIQPLPEQNEIPPQDNINMAEIEKHIEEYQRDDGVISDDTFFMETGEGDNAHMDRVIEGEEDSDEPPTCTVVKLDMASDDDVDDDDDDDDQSDREDSRNIARKIMSAIAKEQLVSKTTNTTTTATTTSVKTQIRSSLVRKAKSNAVSSEDCDNAQRNANESLNGVSPEKFVAEVNGTPKFGPSNAKSQSIFILTGEKKLLEFPMPCKISSGWKCPQCAHSTGMFRSLWTHLKSDHAESGGSLQCTYCDVTLASLPNLQRHYYTTHDTAAFHCCRCQKSCRTYLVYEQHLKDCMDDLPVKSSGSHRCPLCEKQYRSLVTLRAHIDGKHSEKRYKCDFCSRSFNFPSNLVRHTKLHTGERPHQCEQCGQGFIERKCLITHMMRKHSVAGESEGGVHCEVCGKGFGSRSILNVHMLVHSSQRGFTCPVCNKTFSLKANMQRHELTHTGAKPYKCTECGKAFTEKRSVTVHMRQHTGERPFKCPHCPKTFSQSGNLDAHVPVHTGVRKFLCTLCGATFLRRTHHAQHMRKHRGPPDVTCSLCSAAFYRQTDLRRHMLTHSAEPQQQQQRRAAHECHACLRTFTRASSLRDHLNTHTGATPYVCPVCAAQFAEPASLHKHRRTHHQDQNNVDDEAEEDIGKLINVASQLDATTPLQHPAPSQTPQIVYLEQPLDLLAGTEAGGTEVEADPSMDASPSDPSPPQVPTDESSIVPAFMEVPVTEASVEVPARDYSIQIPAIEEVSAMEPGSMDVPAIGPAMAFTEVSELEPGDQVFEIDGLDSIDPSQVAFQQLPDQSGYYLIINRSTAE